MGRIIADPGRGFLDRARQQDFNPRVHLPFAGKQTRHIARGQPGQAADGQHDMGVILADPRPQGHGFGGRGAHVRPPALVAQGCVHVVQDGFREPRRRAAPAAKTFRETSELVGPIHEMGKSHEF